jgi:hypothetical protein
MARSTLIKTGHSRQGNPCVTSGNRYNAHGERAMPYYTQHIQDILDELAIPDVKAYRVRVDQYVQEILGTRDLDAEQVWTILQPKLKDAAWRAQFVEELRAKWQRRDWRSEGL